MPKVYRCCICGRIADNPREANPYKENGYACDLCYKNHVKPAIKERQEKLRRKYRP